MDGDDSDDFTIWIQRSRDGDDNASRKIYEFAYDRLKQIARQSLSGWRADTTLDTTSLVHEFFIKHTRAENVEVEDRRHFYNLAACMMRQIMINSAKKKIAQKRGGELRDSEFVDGMLVDVRSPENLLVVDQLIESMEKSMPDVAEVFIYRTFARMTIKEISDAVGLSPSTVKRRVSFARAFVLRKMTRVD